VSGATRSATTRSTGAADEPPPLERRTPLRAAAAADDPPRRPPRIFRISPEEPPAARVPAPGRTPPEDEHDFPLEDSADDDAFAFLDEDADVDEERSPDRPEPSPSGATAAPPGRPPASPQASGGRRSLRRAARTEGDDPAPPRPTAGEPVEAPPRAKDGGGAAGLGPVLAAAAAVAAGGDAETLARLAAAHLDAAGGDIAARVRLVEALGPFALSSPAVRKVWQKQLRSLDKLVAEDPGAARAAAPALLPVLAGDRLWPLAPPERREAARLLAALNPYTPIAKALAEDHRDVLALFPLLHGEVAELERTLRFAGKHRRVARIAALAVRLAEAGVLDVPDLLAVDARLGDGRFLKSVAAAVVENQAFDVAMRLFVDAGAPATAPAALRALAEQLHAAGELPLLERVLARAASGKGAEWAGLAAAIARRLGLPTLALAGTVARAGGELEPATAIALHHDLLAAGHARAARAVLAVHADSDPDAAHRSCKMAERLDGPEDALAAWRRAEARWPEPRFRAGVGRSLAAALRLAEAEDVLWDLAEAHPDRAGHWRDLARAFQEAGDWEAWGDCLAEARAAMPDDPWLAHAERWAESERGRTAEIADDPAAVLDDAPSARMLAGRLMVEGRAAEAVDLRRAVLERTGDRRDHSHYALALFQSGRFEEAAAEIERCIARFPGDAGLHVKRGQVRERRQDWAAALEAYVQASALDPDNAEAAPGVARCLAYLGRHASLEAWLRRFPQDAPRFGWVHALRAFGAAMAGRSGDVRAALAPLYAACRALRATCETAMQARPATVWTPDGLRQHPLRRAGDYNARFLEILRMLETARSVVLVGNAPALLGSRLGRQIDAHEVVIRLNDFRTVGFEADVGSRTSLWYTRAHRLARPDPASLGSAHVLAQVDTLNQYPPIDEYLRGRIRVSIPFDRATILPSYVLMATDGATYPRPTTGFRIIQFLEFFRQEAYDIAGFEFFRGGGMHYFDVGEDRLQVGEMHAIDFERDFVERVLGEGGRLTRL
jgi:tetratricopeptide (TPR) repeat protein